MDERADQLLKSLSDRTRREMVRVLGEVPLTVGEITEVMGMPQSTVSRHLKTLRETGLLVDRREGNRTYIGLVEPQGNGNGANGGARLGDLLNSWLRTQPLGQHLQERLDAVVESREGGEDSFERLAHQWDDLRFQHFGGLFHLEALASLLPQHWTVLDIGTGTGYFLPFLSRQFKSVIAVDPSSAMLDLARERAHREGLENVRFQLGRLEELPADDDSVDAVLAILVMRHSGQRPKALEELWRVLKAGGRLLAVDIHPHEMSEFQREMGDASPGIDPDALSQELEQAGFRLRSLNKLPMPPPGHPAAPSRPAPPLFALTAEKPTSAREADATI
ncbi:MAG TPA: metalloregulator ArsR/SmtB family transcription factor [Acidobacteriota bacterium]|nr:metalloregulator ArsR/SmtB family transcription factor [Acidobacteriota bacterium]